MTTNVLDTPRLLGDSPCARTLGTVTPKDPSSARGLYQLCSNGTISLARPLPAVTTPRRLIADLFGPPQPAETEAGFAGPATPSPNPPPIEVGTFGDVAVVDFLTRLPSNLTSDDQGSQLLYANVASATGHRRVSILIQHRPMCELNETCG